MCIVMLLTWKEGNTTSSFYLCCLLCVLSMIVRSDGILIGVFVYIQLLYVHIIWCIYVSLLPSKVMCIICMLCVGVQSFIYLHSSVNLLPVNYICLCPCPVFISYVYKLYCFIKPGISILILSNIPSSFDGLLEPDMSLYIARHSQPVVLCMHVLVNALTSQIG